MFKSLVDKLVEAALDQPNPTPELTKALNDVLTAQKHPVRDRSRDPGTLGSASRIVQAVQATKTVFPG